jgi:hypothetical protein
MRATVQQKTPGQTFRQSVLHEQGRGAKQQNTDVLGEIPAIPQQLDAFAPARNLLHLVKHEQHGAIRSPHHGTPPLGLKPCPIQGRRAVGRGHYRRKPEAVGQLPGNGGLADLSRSDQDMHDRRWRFQDSLQVKKKRSLICHNKLISR